MATTLKVKLLNNCGEHRSRFLVYLEKKEKLEKVRGLLLSLLFLLVSDFHVFGEQQGALNYEEKANDHAELLFFQHSMRKIIDDTIRAS